jgi:hypothetical protein
VGKGEGESGQTCSCTTSPKSQDSSVSREVVSLCGCVESQGAQSGVSGLRAAMVISEATNRQLQKGGLRLGDPWISFPVDEGGSIGSKGFKPMQMGSHFQRIWRTLNRTHSPVQAVPLNHEPDLAVPFGPNHKGEPDFAITTCHRRDDEPLDYRVLNRSTSRIAD